MIPSIIEISKALRSGEISPEFIFSETQRNIQLLDSKIHSFSRVVKYEPSFFSDVKRAPLYGVPYSAKDIFDTANVPTEYGSNFFRGHIPSEDAEIISLLKKSGAILQGKTNMHEFAMGIVTPQCNNPWDPNRITGGSSGGSAASVAAGLSFFSLGTDTAGSIRIPASMCGVAGLKPTTGSISSNGVMPESWTLDTIGPITRYASDIPDLLLIMGFKPRKKNFNGKIPRVGIIKNYLEKSDLRVVSTFSAFINKIISEGIISVKEIFIEDLEEIAVMDDIIDGCESATYHRTRFKEHPELFSDRTRDQIQYYSSLSPMDYIEANRLRQIKTNEFNDYFREYDFLISPTLPTIAPFKKEVESVDFAYFMKYMEFTNPFNFTGLPALSIPCGFSNGMPVGIQISGAPYSDIDICNLATKFQEVTEFHKRVPKIARKISYL